MVKESVTDQQSKCSKFCIQIEMPILDREAPPRNYEPVDTQIEEVKPIYREIGAGEIAHAVRTDLDVHNGLNQLHGFQTRPPEQASESRSQPHFLDLQKGWIDIQSSPSQLKVPQCDPKREELELKIANGGPTASGLIDLYNQIVPDFSAEFGFVEKNPSAPREQKYQEHQGKNQ
jgi:hypothetical protein